MTRQIPLIDDELSLAERIDQAIITAEKKIQIQEPLGEADAAKFLALLYAVQFSMSASVRPTKTE